MKRRALWKLSVSPSADLEEQVSQLLSDRFGVAACTHFDVLRGRTEVSIFLEQKPRGFAAKQSEFRSALRLAAGREAQSGFPRLRLRRLPPEDWAESWKRHFKPFEVGAALLVKPSWSRRKPHRAQAVVVLDPGLSFGTGQHATTSFCLRQLVRRRRPGFRQAFLDVGTGSGILAIAASKLGYSPVHAFDFDPEAVRVARANARQNHVSRKLRIWEQDLTQLPSPPPRQYDLVCANLLASLLIEERRRLSKWVASEGVLVLAGVLDAEFAEVRSAYERIGFRLLASRREREWRSAAFRRRERHAVPRVALAGRPGQPGSAKLT